MKYIEADRLNKYLEFNPWSGHREYVYDLIQELKPSNIVELGSHYGCSLFTMAQAIKDNNINCTLYAVDTWEGTGEIGAYDNTVYETVIRTKEEYYNSVDIRLMRMFFEEARQELKKELDNKIDLLHIDGSHEYENVKQDFETWIDLMSSHGVIMFHDTGTGTNQGSEVYWNEIKEKYQYTISFNHSWGLGILFLNEKEYIKANKLLEKKDYKSAEDRRADLVAHKLADYHFELCEAKKYIKDLEEWNSIKEKYLKAWEESDIDKEKYIQELEKQKEELLQHLKGWEENVKEKEKYIQDLEYQKEELSQHLRNWEESAKAKEEYIQELGKQKEEVLQHLRGWEENVKGKERYIQDLEYQKEELLQHLRAWEKNVKEKERYIKELESEKNILNVALDEEKQINTNNIKISSYLKEIEIESDNKSIYIQDLEKRQVELSEHLEDWKKVVQGKDTYISELLNKNVKLNEELEAWQNNCKDKDNYIIQLEEEKEILTKKSNEYHQYIKQLQKEREEFERLSLVKKLKYIIGGKKE